MRRRTCRTCHRPTPDLRGRCASCRQVAKAHAREEAKQESWRLLRTIAPRYGV